MPVKSFRVKSTGRRMRVRSSKKVPQATKTYVQKAIKKAPETKYTYEDLRGATNIPYDSPILQILTTLAQGSVWNGRDGDRIMPVSLTTKLHIDMQDVNAIARVIVFQWKANNADDVPSAAKLFEAGALTADSVDYQLMQRKVDRAKFKVLYDRRYTYQNSQNVLDVINIKTKDLASKYIYYDDSASSSGKNHIYVLAFSNRTGAQTEPIIYYDWVMKFKDM